MMNTPSTTAKFKEGNRIRSAERDTGVIAEARWRSKSTHYQPSKGEHQQVEMPESWVYRVQGERYNANVWYEEVLLEGW